MNPGSSLALNVDMDKFMQQAVTDGNLADVLKEVYVYCQAKFNVTPLGKAVTARAVADVKKQGKLKNALFSGSLGQLALSTEAVPNNIDTGRIAATLSGIHVLADAVDKMGTIIINVDTWTADDADQLLRAHCDAEIAATCLIAFAHKEFPEHTEELLAPLADLVFDARPLGSGANFMCCKLDLIKKEEDKRQCAGMSAFRLCK